MKIEINFDLLSKIADAKTGFNLNKTTAKVIGYTAISTTISSLIINSLQVTPEVFISIIPGQLLVHSSIHYPFDFILAPLKKEEAVNELKILSHLFKNINVNTNHELLLNSYKYKTTYHLNESNKLRNSLEQKKYIMVPVYNNSKEKEVSIVQEHIIGTKKYYLSCGEPEKVLKLSLNPI